MTLLGIIASQNYPRYVPTVLADNPLGFWLLNETTGTTGDDLTANNNDLTFHNSPTLNVSTGLAGIPTGITFDGTNDRLDTSTVATFNIAASSTWSIELWAKYTISTFGNLIAWRDGTGLQTGVTGTCDINQGSTPGRIRCGTADSSGNNLTLIHDGGYNNDIAHHIVVSATSGGAMRLYIDGVDRANTTTARNTTTSNRSIVVGANRNGVSTYFQFYTGLITACAVYNTALSASQVLAHYNAGV